MAAVTPPRPSRPLSLRDLFGPHWKSLTLAFIAVLGETAADVLEPWPIKIVIDSVVNSKALPSWLGAIAAELFSHSRYEALNIAIAAVAAIAVLDALSTYAEKSNTAAVGQWVAHDLRRILYHHIEWLSLADHAEARSGDLISRVTDDIGAVQDFINTALVGIFVNIFTLLSMIGVMFWVNWRFTLIALAVTPLLFAVVYAFTRRIKAASRAVRKRESAIVSDVAEVLTSIRVVKAFAREEYEEKRFEAGSLESVKASLEARNIKVMLPPLVNVIVAIGTCLVLGYGARLALTGQISAGILVVFVLYLGKMYKPMKELSKMTDTVSKAAVGYERIQEVLGLESSVRDERGARRAPSFKGAIEFDRVLFRYGEASALVLDDVSFRIEPGQTVALVGPSGAGKSTIASLIPRFYDPVSGIVKIDGTDIRQYKLKSLRRQIGFVLQETLLFRATIWDNIAYGKPNASRKEIVRAAQLSNSQEFIDRLAQGYHTMVGERGATLSGGERQRIAIARAILQNAPILILDEPTASLDAASEEAVIEAVERLMKKRTCLVIAHHLSTIRNVDMIFVLQDATLVERGTREELIARGGAYAALEGERRDIPLASRNR